MNVRIRTDKSWQIIELSTKIDKRGSLTFIQEGGGCPFTMRRVFVVHNVPQGLKRGGHAHYESWQLHFCLNGLARVWIDDCKEKKEVVLDSPSQGLLVAPMVWSEFELSSLETILVVVSSNLYDPKDYIRDYDEFKTLVANT